MGSGAARNALWEYVAEIEALVRAYEPENFTAWGAAVPHAWANLRRQYRGLAESAPRAHEAALALTAHSELRRLYANTTGGSEWLTDQVENLARRTMLISSDRGELRRRFDLWFPRFVRALNSDTIRTLEALEVFGLRPRRGSSFRPFPKNVRLDGTSQRIITRIERVDLEDVLARYPHVRPPDLPSSLVRWERPDSVIYTVGTEPKSEGRLVRRIGSPNPHSEYIYAARFETGRWIGTGGWLIAELSPFPREDPSYFDQRPELARDLEEANPQELDLALHRRIRRRQQFVARFHGRPRSGEGALDYAYRRLEAIQRPSSPWYDSVIGCVSAVEALLTDVGSGGANPGRKQLAQRLVWLSGLDGEQALRLFTRFDRLYDARNKLMHRGAFGAKTYRIALQALDVQVEHDPVYPEDMISSAEWWAWQRTAVPRLVALLRWVLLACAALETVDDQLAVGWPFRGQRKIDLDMALSRRSLEWQKPLRRLSSPLMEG